MEAIIFLNGFKHNNTPLMRLFFYPCAAIEDRMKQLDYVHYSYQYACYYTRWKPEHFKMLKKDFNGLASLSIKYLDTSAFPYNKRARSSTHLPDNHNANDQVVAISVVDEKAYVVLPYPYKQEWTHYLKDFGAQHDARRRVWILQNYTGIRMALHDFFRNQRCRIYVSYKVNEKISNRLKRSDYKADEEIQSFVKVMTLQGAGKRTIENYSCQIKKIKEYYEGRLMVDISDEEIRDYLFFLREELSYSYSAQNIVVSAVKRFFLSLTEREFNNYQLPRPKKLKSLPKVLTREEVQVLLRQPMYIKHRCLLYMLYSTGIRCGELVNLKVEDIDFKGNLVVIKKGKGRKDRIVSLSEKMKTLLLAYLRKVHPSVFLFEGQNGYRYSTGSVQKVVKKAVQKAGIDKRVTPHMLRHSYATHLHDSGVDIRHIQKLLGHSSTKTTEIYTYVSKRDIKAIKSPLDDLEI